MALFGFPKFALDFVSFLQPFFILVCLLQFKPDLLVAIFFLSTGSLQMNGGMQPTVFQIEMVIAIIIAFVPGIGVHGEFLLQIVVYTSEQK